MMDLGALLGLASLVGTIILTVIAFSVSFKRGGSGGGVDVTKYLKQENEELREQNKLLMADKEAQRIEFVKINKKVEVLEKDNAALKAENAELRTQVAFLFKQVTGKDLPPKIQPQTAAPRRAVLFVSTSPIQGAILNTGVEARAIEDALRKSGYEFKAIQAARPHDITRAILDFKPTILHFAGHGAAGELFLEDDLQRPKAVTLEAIARLLKPMPVTGVVLNACFSAKNLSPLMAVSEWAIGMKREVEDPSSIAISDGLYLALADGKDIQSAFDIGVANAGMQNAGQMDIPVLEVRR